MPQGEGHRRIPIVSFDYCFIGDKGGIEDAGEDGTAVKVLMVRDNKSKSLFGMSFHRRVWTRRDWQWSV